MICIPVHPTVADYSLNFKLYSEKKTKEKKKCCKLLLAVAYRFKLNPSPD